VQRVVGHDQAGYLAFGQDEATHRLFYGWAPELPEMIKNEVSKASWTKVEKIFSTGAVMRQPATAPMPFADAIALARYLVDVTVGYSRYLLGPDIVGGPVEVAGITRHEGFRWVTRKHYYPQALNPEDPGHDY
jgi:hypothetical protein